MSTQLTARELDALSAWWLTGSVVAAAALLGLSEQTAKNQLYTARLRTGSASNVALVQKYLRNLRSMESLVAQHKVKKGEAA